ncbi:Auxin response factor 8 [Triticum urartu]|uniref:Auxin response factor 8 n=1 Tax=Triticum urartu TaxID=4572 RepID=M7YEI9_TRIUA|nr:Auxin response factor 8 [Triticum urartu]
MSGTTTTQPSSLWTWRQQATSNTTEKGGDKQAPKAVQWCPGMRFKMAFETEDSSRISWFMGTVAGIHAADPSRWPQSPWRLLQVTWDEPELLQNVKRVCPWLVELVSSMPNLHLPSFSPPRKKPRIPSYADFPFEGQLFHPPPPPFPPGHHHQQDQLLHHSFPFFPFPDSNGAPLAGIQGARHAQFGPSFSDLHLSNLQSSLLYAGGAVRRPAADHVAPRAPRTISTDLTIGTSPAREDDPTTTRAPTKKAGGDVVKPAPTLLLFGQAILTEEQMKSSSTGGDAATSPVAGGCGSPNWDAEKAPNLSEGSGSGSGVIQGSPSNNNNTSSWRLQWFGDSSSQAAPELLGLEAGQCKVFVESDAVGRNLDLSALSSFEELYGRMAEMFGMECAELRNHVLYRSAAGEVKHIGDEPFSAFVKSARRLTILTDAGSDNIGG